MTVVPEKRGLFSPPGGILGPEDQEGSQVDGGIQKVRNPLSSFLSCSVGAWIHQPLLCSSSPRISWHTALGIYFCSQVCSLVVAALLQAVGLSALWSL